MQWEKEFQIFCSKLNFRNLNKNSNEVNPLIFLFHKRTAFLFYSQIIKNYIEFWKDKNKSNLNALLSILLRRCFHLEYDTNKMIIGV